MPSAFPATSCPIEPVSAVPTLGWFSDTSVPEGPEPINTCPTVTLAPVPPPPLCPVMEQTVTGTVQRVAAGGESIVLTVSQLPDCAFSFGLAAAFPIECPALPPDPAPAQPTVTTTPPGQGYFRGGFNPKHHDGVWYIQNSDGSITSVSAPADAACAFDFVAHIGFPCPTVAATYAGTIAHALPGSEYINLTVTDAGSCNLGFAVDAAFPYTNCVQFALKPPVVRTVPAGQEGAYLSFAPDGSDCSYQLGLEIAFPCPRQAAKYTAKVATVPTVAEAAATFYVLEKGDCSFSFSADLAFPEVCPSVTLLNKARMTTVPLGQEYFSLSLVHGTDACAFSFVPEIAFPCANLPSPIRASGISLHFGHPRGDPCSLSIDAVVLGTPPPVTFGIGNTGSAIPPGECGTVTLTYPYSATVMACNAFVVNTVGGGHVVILAYTPDNPCGCDWTVVAEDCGS